MNYKFSSSFILILLFCLNTGSFSIGLPGTTPGHNTVTISRFEVRDIGFTLKKSAYKNPFDIRFGAIVEGPDGITKNIPGFYDGNGKWILRFSSEKTGSFNYKTYSTLPDLSGLKGSISVQDSQSHGHGGIVIDPLHPQRFSYQDGTAYFALAFELDWLFALDYHNSQSLPKTEKILNTIKENGLNQVVMNVFAYDVAWPVEKNLPPEYNYSRPDFYPFLGSNEKPDYSELNPEYFRHLDRVISLLNDKGIIAHLMIYVWNKKVSWPEMYSHADNQYFDYVISRYQAFPNIIWDVSKEALDYGRCDIPYINERISRIRSADAYKRLITVHDYEYCSREADKVDFISIQSWRSQLYSQMTDVIVQHSDKPVLNIEHGGYESGPYLTFRGNYNSPETCLERNYESVFAGAYSTYYWQNTSWNIVVWNPFENPAIKPVPRFDYYRHMAEFFRKYDFNNLISTRQKSTTNSIQERNNISSAGLPLSNGKDLFLIYLPAEVERTNTTFPNPLKKRMKVSWFNIFTGIYQEDGIRNWQGWDEFIPPWKDIPSILIIELVD